MLTLTSAQQQALDKRAVKRRNFIWCDAIDLAGNPDPAGFWDDVGTVDLDGRTYHGSGTVISLSALAARSDLSIPGLQITISGIEIASVDLVRAHALAQAPITVSTGIYDVSANALIPPLIRRFVGKVDDVEIVTPAAGDKGSIVLTCESSSRALTIRRTETRSQASLSQRAPYDRFYDYTAGQREQALYFGRKGP